MKAIILYFTLSICILADERKRFDELELVDGKVYKKVVIRKKNPDSISIMHASGMATIPYEKIRGLDQNLMGGFDEKEALAYRKKIEAKEEARRAVADKIIESRKKNSNKASEETLKPSKPESAKTNNAKVPSILNTAWIADFTYTHNGEIKKGEIRIRFSSGGKVYTYKKKPHNHNLYPINWRQNGNRIDVLYNTGKKDSYTLSGKHLKGGGYSFRHSTLTLKTK